MTPASPPALRMDGLVGRTIILNDGRSGRCESAVNGFYMLKLHTSTGRVDRVNVRSAQIAMERTMAADGSPLRPEIHRSCTGPDAVVRDAAGVDRIRRRARCWRARCSG